MELKKQKKNLVLLPKSLLESHYVGKIYGTYFDDSGVFNIFTEEMMESFSFDNFIGEIFEKEIPKNYSELAGLWEKDCLVFDFQGESFSVEVYDLVQNVFSRNTGILESNLMKDKCAFILGCGSVGSLVALELARAGVGKFVLIDNDIVEYHNLCRHQCSIADVGDYKVNAVARRIQEINPLAIIERIPKIVEEVGHKIFDSYCENAIVVGCADNRMADVYANSISIAYDIPFISIGFWERAFAGEIFYHLPNKNMACYKCALGDGSELSQRQSTNRRVYTNEENLLKVNFEPGISVDINFVTTIGIKLVLDILNIGNEAFTSRLLNHLQQYTLVCNTNNPKIGGEIAEIFSHPLQITTSLKVKQRDSCSFCKEENK